jgi:hypothetical protein
MFTTSYAIPREYIVIRKLFPIVETPGMKYELSERAIDIVDGIKSSVVYGNIIQAETVRGRKFRKWLQVKIDGKDYGFIERKAVARVPNYRRMKPEIYYINRSNVLLFIVPGKRGLSRRHGGITLPYGMSVLGVGTLTRGSTSWTLLKFEDDSSSNDRLDVLNTGSRYGWVRTKRLQRFPDEP